jgi:hypothetical protein
MRVSKSSGTAIFEATGQLAAFNLLLAGVLVESAFRDTEICGSLCVLEPDILDVPSERKTGRVRRLGLNLIGYSRERLA